MTPDWSALHESHLAHRLGDQLDTRENSIWSVNDLFSIQ